MSIVDVVCLVVASFIAMLLVTPFKNTDEDEED
jgi:hypothetical protein